MPSPSTDPVAIRAQQDEDWNQCPAVTRLGAEGAIRRERMNTRTRPALDGLPGTAARSAGGMAALRAKLNSIRSVESRTGTAHTTTFSSVVESARTTQEPFKPKSTVNVVVTPSTGDTFAAKCTPIAERCGVEWDKVKKRRYTTSHEPVRIVLQLIAPVKDDATPEDVEALSALLAKLQPMREMFNMDDDDLQLWYGIEDAPPAEDVERCSQPPCRAARRLHKKQLVIRIFSRDEDQDIPTMMAKDFGEVWGDVNPLLNHMDCLLKGFTLKVESGEGFTDTMVSRDAAVKPLGNMRVTTKAELSSELAAKLSPAALNSFLELSRGRRNKRRQQEANTIFASTLPLLATNKIESHVTVDSPEHLLFNLIRQLTFLTRAQNGDQLPGSTMVEESVASAVSHAIPLGATGLNLWNLLNFQWAFLQLEGEDELIFSPLIHAAMKVCGPITTASMDGRVLSAKITVDGLDPAQHAFTSLEDQLAYVKALGEAAKKADQAANPIYAEDSSSDYSDSDDDFSDERFNVDDADEDDDQDSKLTIWAKQQRLAACRKVGIKKSYVDEDHFGTLGFQNHMHRTKPKLHNIGTYNQKVNRRNAALVVGIRAADKNHAAALVRAWSTDNRVDGDVFERIGEGVNVQYIGRVGRYTMPDGRAVLFSTYPDKLSGTLREGTIGRCCDAFVVVGGKDESVDKTFLDTGFSLNGQEAPKKVQYPWLHDDNCEVFHLTVGSGAEPKADKGPYYTGSYAVPAEDFAAVEAKEALLRVREVVVASAMSKHSTQTPNNGWDHPFTQMVTMGKTVIMSKKARKAAAAEKAVVANSSDSSDSD